MLLKPFLVVSINRNAYFIFWLVYEWWMNDLSLSESILFFLRKIYKNYMFVFVIFHQNDSFFNVHIFLVEHSKNRVIMFALNPSMTSFFLFASFNQKQLLLCSTVCKFQKFTLSMFTQKVREINACISC